MRWGDRFIVLLVVALATALFGVGCGGKSDEAQVKDTVNQFSAAASSGDYRLACKDLTHSARLDAGGSRCRAFLEVTYATDFPRTAHDLAPPTISKVTITGSTAIVAFTGRSQTMHLKKVDGDWLVSGF